MDARDGAGDAPRHDAFISYSRHDKRFAVALERALRRYRPPKGLPVPNRALDVFRDEEDFTGTEYYGAVQTHLDGSRKLILLCSPDACRSAFLNDEIRRFVKTHSPSDIVPVLVAGLPNNEIRGDDPTLAAFPPALCERLELPLAADFRDFNTASPRPDGRQHRAAWYKLIADIYGCSRAEVEEREKKRTRQRRLIWSGVAAVVAAAIGAAVAAAIFQGARADREARAAMSNQLAGQAAAIADKNPELGTLLALEAAAYGETPAAASALRGALARLPDATLTITPSGGFDAPAGLDVSSDNARLAIADGQPTIRILDLETHQQIAQVGQGSDALTWARFSRDGKWIAAGTNRNSTVYDLASGHAIARVAGRLRWVDIEARGGLAALIMRERDAQVVEIDAAGSVRQIRTVAPFGYSNDLYEPLTTVLSPDSRRLATLDEDTGRVAVTDLDSGFQLSRLILAPKGIWGLAWSPGGTMLGASSLFGFAALESKRLETRALVQSDDAVVVEDLAFASEDALATTDRGGTATLRHLPQTADVVALHGEDARAYRPTFSPDRPLLSVIYANGRAGLWDLETHRRLTALDSLWGGVWNIRFLPGGAQVAVEYEAGRLAFWSLDRWHRRMRVPLDYQEVEDVRIDGVNGAIGVQAGGGLRSWNLATGAAVNTGKVLATVQELTRTQAGSRSLRLAGRDVQVIDTAAGRPLLRLPHSDDVEHATFDPDGVCVATSGVSRMASGGAPEDGDAVRLWDAKSGMLLQELRLGTFGADAALFAGDRIVVLHDRAAFVYQTPLCGTVSALVRLARARVPRALTAEERATYVGSVEAGIRKE